MKSLEGRVAVVTGASSGIGRASAVEFARRGMKVVIASQNPGRLDDAKVELEKMGADVLAVPTDVEKREDVQRLADATIERFGAVHLLVNNAGVWAPGYAWEIPEEDWKWVFGVNVWGTVYGIQIFTPLLLAQDEGHIVNVSSTGGLMTAPTHSPYCAAKHAVVGLSKGLRADFAIKQAKIGVTVVCPGAVKTNIMSQIETTGPGGVPRGKVELPEEVEQMWDVIGSTTDAGIPAAEVGTMIADAVEANQFWLLPNGQVFHDVFDAELAEIKAEK